MTLSAQDRAIHDRLAGRVTDGLVAEHRGAPFGPHSPALQEVLDFLRRNPAPDLPRYVVLDQGGSFAVATRTARGLPPEPVDAERHPDEAAAEHAVFLRRLADYELLP